MLPHVTAKFQDLIQQAVTKSSLMPWLSTNDYYLNNVCPKSMERLGKIKNKTKQNKSQGKKIE